MMKKQILLTFTSLLLPFIMLAQSDETKFTDYRPVYRKWKDNYILDKIEYRPHRMVFHFRFISRDAGQATFYGPGERDAWFVRDGKGETHKLLEIRNIRKNGELKVSLLNSKTRVSYEHTTDDIMTCEVHFDRMPIGTEKVDLIEGIGQETNENHFNCFDVAVKDLRNPKELGDEEDMRRRIRNFESPEEAVLLPDLLQLTNDLRTNHGFCARQRVPAVQPVTWDDQLAEVAKALVVELWTKDELHTYSGSQTIIRQLESRGYETELAYETILLYQEDGLEEVFANWKAMGAQCKRIRDPRIRVMGAARKDNYWLMILAR
ncbi:MAG: CAP domain-containing protein [Bacteroidota bacterium]